MCFPPCSQNWRQSLVLKITVAVVLKALVFPLAGRFGKKGIVHLLGKTGLTGPNVPKVSAPPMLYWMVCTASQLTYLQGSRNPLLCINA